MVESGISCPIDDCSFDGAVESVKNHITAKTDDPHKGKKGEDVVHEAQASEQAESGAEGSDDGADEDVDGGGESVVSEPAEQSSEDSLVWVVGAGLVALYLVLTGQSADGEVSGSSVERDIV